MKQIFIITILLSVLMAAYSFAQMGHGMMREGHMMGQQGMQGQQDMTGQQGMMGSGQMMENRQMMGNMMGMTQDMAIIMRQMSEIMGNTSDMSRDRMHRMTDMMKDMAAEMSRISDIIGKDGATNEEINIIRNKIMEMRRQMLEMK